MCVALEAARDGLLDVVKAHIDSAQSQINDVDDEGYTAMHYAARYNRVAVMDALFAAGAGTIIHAYIYHSTISLSLSLSLSSSQARNGRAPIQLAQCWFPRLAISSAKIVIYISNKICGSNFIKQRAEAVML